MLHVGQGHQDTHAEHVAKEAHVCGGKVGLLAWQTWIGGGELCAWHGEELPLWVGGIGEFVALGPGSWTALAWRMSVFSYT